MQGLFIISHAVSVMGSNHKRLSTVMDYIFLQVYALVSSLSVGLGVGVSMFETPA
jgi:hypothetical protein